MYVAITQLELKDIWKLPSFVYHTRESRKQAQASPGYISHGYNLVGGFYTRSAWKTHEDMIAFKRAGAHATAMKEIALQVAKGGRTLIIERDDVPSWPEAKRLLLEKGRDVQPYLQSLQAQRDAEIGMRGNDGP